jgi:predicted protein tyrosine phosphatase
MKLLKELYQMKCFHCGHTWDAGPSHLWRHAVCPVCDTPAFVDDTICEIETLKEFLEYVSENYEVSILTDREKLFTLFQNCESPISDILEVLFNYGIVDILSKHADADSAGRKAVVDRCVQILLDEYYDVFYGGVTAEEAVCDFLDAISRKINLLFVCSANRDRSPTAETVFARDERFRVRSAGVAQYARTQVSESLLDWADKIIVMEPIHEQVIRERWPDIVADKTILCLKISDDYRYMDPKLETLLRGRMQVLTEKGLLSC